MAGAAIATLAGVAGMVWKQNDRFYLRGVPVAENGSTITLGAATEQGLRTATVPAVRRLRRSRTPRATTCCSSRTTPPRSTTSARSRWTRPPARRRWDPSVSYGTFPLPISAATLHSSGRVVAVHTDNGRIGSLLPANTPPAAAGHLQRRTGHPDRAAELPRRRRGHEPRHRPRSSRPRALQLAAFDLNGNPVALLRRRVRRADPALAGHPRAERAGVSRLHPAARLQGQLPRHGRRRLGPDLRALLHGRRHPPRPTTASTSTAPRAR